MTAKEQKIKEAYGDYWEECKNYIDSNGWIGVGVCHNNKPIDFEIFEIELDSEFEEVPFGYFKELRETVRPKSLQGIENNNGWIRIESEEDVPRDFENYHVVSKECGVIIGTECKENTAVIKYWMEHFTHYQPIVKPEPPIY